MPSPPLPRRAAVVGAGGFIGRHLVTALRGSGWHVVTNTRTDEPYRPFGPEVPDVVFYLASSITPALAEAQPERASADHRRFAGFLRHLAGADQPSTVVLSSSAGTVYDPEAPQPWAEDAPTRPATCYGAAKLALEELLLAHAGRLPGVILRLSNVYGPGQRVDKGQGVLGFWLHAAAAGLPLQVIGDPRARRDYVYVDDVVDCLLRVAAGSSARAGEPAVLNVGSGVSTSLADLLSTVERAIGHSLPVRAVAGRGIDRRDVCLDVGRAQQCLGWQPRTPLVDGVATTWRHRQSPAAARQ